MQKDLYMYSGAVVYNAYIDGLMKGGNPQKAEAIFQRMKRDCCEPSVDTYTMLINLYGKVCSIVFIIKLTIFFIKKCIQFPISVQISSIFRYLMCNLMVK
jgi:pentatricopeptide repeat protein